MKHIDWIDFMKLRASVGIINGDNIPEEHYWEPELLWWRWISIRWQL
jgi:hypothetical protein